MNKNLLKLVLVNKKDFVPSIFTANQIRVLEDYSKNKKLSLADKKTLYVSINKKFKALETMYVEHKDYYIKGNPIPSRLEEAKKIIDTFNNEKVFVAGSFLFSEEYSDIDIFILRNKGYKEKRLENKHIVYITEKQLSQAVFQSASLISVSNFDTHRTVIFRKPFLHEVMSVFHESIIQLKNEDSKKESVRDLLFMYYYFVKKELASPLTLKQNFSLEQITLFFRELCNILFSKKYLYVELLDYTKTLDKAMLSEKNVSHLEHYKKTYEELIHHGSQTIVY